LGDEFKLQNNNHIKTATELLKAKEQEEQEKKKKRTFNPSSSSKTIQGMRIDILNGFNASFSSEIDWR